MSALRRLRDLVRFERSFRDLNPYAVGIGSVLVIGAIVGFAFMVGLFHLLEDAYTVKAVFPDAAALRAGDEVKVAGVKSGRVTSIGADHRTGTVIVEMVVDRGVHLGPRPTAEIALETLLGTKHVKLGGPVIEPYFEDLPEAQRVIPLERTKTPFDIFELTRIGTRSIQATDTERLDTFINDLADITEGQHDTVARLVDGLTRVTAAVNEREAQLRSLLDRADELTALLAEKDRTLVALIDQSRTILSVLAERRDDLAAALGSGNAAVNEMARVLIENEAELQGIIDRLTPTLEMVDARQADLNRALAVVGPAQVLQSRTGAHGPWLDIYVRAMGPDVIGALEEAFAVLEGS